MIYDRDIRWERRVLVALLLVNLAMAAANFAERHWLIAATCLIWTSSCAVALRMARDHQMCRDEMRLIAAALAAAESAHEGIE